MPELQFERAAHKNRPEGEEEEDICRLSEDRLERASVLSNIVDPLTGRNALQVALSLTGSLVDASSRELYLTWEPPAGRTSVPMG